MTAEASPGVRPGPPPRRVAPWGGERDTAGTVAVVGLGKIGLPLAAQYAAAGWHVIGVDIDIAVVESIAAGRSHILEEPGLPEAVASAHAAGRLDATTSHADAARRADVVVMIVPIMLSAANAPDHRAMEAATEAVARGVRPGALVLYETTLPVGETRERYGPLIGRISGHPVGDPTGVLLAFSPERVFSGRIFRDLATYPKLVGGIDRASTTRAAAFYESVLAADVWQMPDAETAEFAKLAETTYRDVNIALANEFARYAERSGVDILDVIRAANSQPFSHIHQPGIGVGGHCIPVYPHFLLAKAPDLDLVAASRETNDAQIERGLAAIEQEIGDLRGVAVLVLGLTYREGVNELAYSRGPALVARLVDRGAEVWAYDPLLDASAIVRCGARPYQPGTVIAARVIVTQTADTAWLDLHVDDFPELTVVLDGRNSLRVASWPASVTYLGIGLGRRRRS
jgi:nucleotide sugar dehydrogenase